MLDSVNKKLFALSITTMLLTLFIVVSFSRVSFEREKTKSELDQVVNLQLSVDMLRSQLWVFLQFSDEQSLGHVEHAQVELAEKLTQYKQNNALLENMIRMNQSLKTILNQEKKVYFSDASGMNTFGAEDITARGLLHSRYNMIVQNMTEELAYVHQSVLANSDKRQNQVMIYAGAWLVISSIIVSVLAWRMFFRFRTGVYAIKRAIARLADGKLDTKIDGEDLDTEFLAVAKFFNKMTKSLRETTVTKQELEEEVRRQTEQLKLKQEQLLYLSEHDHLTNIMNRRAFDNKLDSAILNAARTQCKLALFFIDLDKFKEINDSYGHDAGDVILVEVAKRLTRTVRETDFVGRIGGDEFIVCLDHLHDFKVVPAKAKQLIDSINEPIIFNDHTLNIGASIGVSYYPDQTQSKDNLLSVADEAMYRAKQLKKSAGFDRDSSVCQVVSDSVVTLASVKEE